MQIFQENEKKNEKTAESENFLFWHFTIMPILGKCKNAIGKSSVYGERKTTLYGHEKNFFFFGLNSSLDTRP